jgi:hypothetical protein
MGRKYKDNALTTLLANITAVSTTLQVAAGKGDNFPAVTGRGVAGSTPDFFVITMEDAAGNIEKMRIEQRTAASDVLGSVAYPLVRGYDGTVARAWNAGDSVDLRWEHKGVQDHEDALAGALLAKLFGYKDSTTAGLNFGYYGGQLYVDGAQTTIADGVLALTLNQTNYVERDAAGVVSANVVGFSANKVPLYEVTTDGAGITTITERRAHNLPLYGKLTINVAGGAGNTVLTADQARAPIIEFTGLLTGNRTIELPTIKRAWIVHNNTTGAFTLQCKTNAGVGPVIQQGTRSVVYGDGVDIVDAMSSVRSLDISGVFSLSGTLSPAQIVANQDDYNPAGLATANVLRISSDAARNITGIQGGASGRLLTVENIGNFPITLKHEVTSAAANRFALGGNDIIVPAASLIVLWYDAVLTRWKAASAPSATSLPRGYIDGLTLSPNAIDAVNDIDIAAGVARSLTDTADLVLTAALTKQLDAVWAVGTNQGMRASGAAIANGTYWIFQIKRPDTGVVDIAADTSPTGANIAANTNAAYTEKRRLGAILREAGAIAPFVQTIDTFRRKVPVQDVNAASSGVLAVTRTLSVPVGDVVQAIVTMTNQMPLGSGQRNFFLSALTITDTAPGVSASNSVGRATSADGGGGFGGGEITIDTNASAQIRSRQDSGGASDVLGIITHGWIDRRGKA